MSSNGLNLLARCKSFAEPFTFIENENNAIEYWGELKALADVDLIEEFYEELYRHFEEIESKPSDWKCFMMYNAEEYSAYWIVNINTNSGFYENVIGWHHQLDHLYTHASPEEFEESFGGIESLRLGDFGRLGIL